MSSPDDPDLTSGPPSGDTEPGTPERRRAIAVIAGIGTALAAIIAVAAIALSSSGEPASPKAIESVTKDGPPASSLEQNPQPKQYGSDGS